MANISERWPTSRKRHRCDSCSKLIEPGQKYLSQFHTDGGDVWTYKAHEDCVAAMRLLSANGVYSDDDYWLNLVDFGSEDRALIESEDPALYARLFEKEGVA